MRLTALVLAAALAPLCCGAAPIVVPLAAGGESWKGEVADYRGLSGAIVELLSRKYQLPVPRHTLEIYAAPAEFEAALVANLAISEESARAAASFAKAAVGNLRIMVNEPAFLTWSRAERVVGLAHEIVHACQAELVGDATLPRFQWLVEGFAEWMGYRVAHDLGIADFVKERAGMVSRVRTAHSAVGLAPLMELDTLEQWIEARRIRSFDAMYPYVFLAVDFLLTRHSYNRALDFFPMLGDSRDTEAGFRAAFGESLAQFQAALDAHLAKTLK
jgi:hypothetical protein